MEERIPFSNVPVSETVLREVARNVAGILPNFLGTEPAIGVKCLHHVLDPILETADLPDLESTHRAAASNALCAIIEHCQTSDITYVRNAIVDDSIWTRIFIIYLQRSVNTKGKSMKQLLVVLTSTVSNDQDLRALALREYAAASFLDIICQRQDRTTVKPALQGLAHLLLKGAVSVEDLLISHAKLLQGSGSEPAPSSSPQTLFKAFLAWIVHHDTSLSAGHLIKNFLLQARRSSNYGNTSDGTISPFWIEPIIQTLQDWPDRIQEFKTHVFPYCFLPNIDEYLHFLSYLHFETHVISQRSLPGQLRALSHAQNGLEDPEEFRILLAAIGSGKELSIVRDNDYRITSAIEVRDGALYLPDEIPGTWMLHVEPQVRLAGMFLSVYSISITRPLSSGVLDALKRNLTHLHTETDADFRREVLGYTQKLFDRLRASTATSEKRKSKSKASTARMSFPNICHKHRSLTHNRTRQDICLDPLTFVVWFLGFLEWELRSTASYQRRIMALRSLTIVLRSGLDPGVPKIHLSKSAQGDLNWAHGLKVANPRLLRTLLDLVLDPFDDVRETAISVLQLCLSALPQSEVGVFMAGMSGFLSRAEVVMLRTGRADHADGVARAYGMIFSIIGDGLGAENACFSSKLVLFRNLGGQLEDTLAVAQRDLSEAVNGRPVHGIFAALRYIIDQDGFYTALTTAPGGTLSQWKELHDNVVAAIENLWVTVHHVLCADAPEGHIPEEVEDDAGLDTKEILSYSWRALKEASVLLRSVISRAPIGTGEDDLITPELFEKLGRLCFTQLLELRHRGAFSTVSQTFVAICRRCVSSKIPTLRALPEMWYKETLQSIQEKSDAITRRSAGIPAAMTALLAAEPQVGGPFFQRAINDLVGETVVEAQSANIEESRLPQVHALNCIKEIFTTSRLSVASEAYIGQGLELAAKTLNSKIWPLRNCSLMLFKALIERLLGSDEAQDWKERDRAKTSRFSYNDYPSLTTILSNLLDPTGPLRKSLESTPDSNSPFDLHGAEGVFPALQILRQARPSEPSLTPIRDSVSKLFASPHWHLREMASRTWVSLHHPSELFKAVLAILTSNVDRHNTQHGILMAVKYSLAKLLRDPAHLASENFTSLVVALTNSARKRYDINDCPSIRSTYLDIISSIGISMLHRTDAAPNLHVWTQLAASVSIGPGFNIATNTYHSDALLHVSLARAFFIDRVILEDISLVTRVALDYQSEGDALTLLATEDPDTCCAALETLNEILQLKKPNGMSVPLSLVLAHIQNGVIESTDSEVISKAQHVLADALEDNDLRTDFFSMITEAQTICMIEKLEAQCIEGPPSNMQSALRLLSFFLDFAFLHYHQHRSKLLQAIARYVRLLRKTTIDTNSFDTRFAAVQSILGLEHIWVASTKSRNTSPLILGLALVVYDQLNDDDDEIRDLAARAVSKFLRAQGHHTWNDTVPILSARKLVTYLVVSFSQSKDLPSEAMRRLTNTVPPTKLFSTPFVQTFEHASKEDTALFAQEKQNLYRDESLDAVLWSRVLMALVPTSTLYHDLAQWVLEALALLTQTAEKEVDGALGWTAKPEIFALGMRVFCAAEVVLAWSGAGERMRVNDERVWAGEGRSKVVAALGKFAEAGRAGDVHGLWMQRVNRILEDEVLRVLAVLRESLSGMQSKRME